MSDAGKTERSSKSGRFKAKPAKEPSTAKWGRVRSVDVEHRRSYDTVKLPIETLGECKYSLSCNQFMTVLGNGLCLSHWDKYSSGQTV